MIFIVRGALGCSCRGCIQMAFNFSTRFGFNYFERPGYVYASRSCLFDAGIREARSSDGEQHTGSEVRNQPGPRLAQSHPPASPTLRTGPTGVRRLCVETKRAATGSRPSRRACPWACRLTISCTCFVSFILLAEESNAQRSGLSRVYLRGVKIPNFFRSRHVRVRTAFPSARQYRAVCGNVPCDSV